MDDVDNSKSGINRNPSLVNVATVWLILAVVILIIIGSFFGYSYFTETMELKNKELTLWFIFMLFAAVISCIFGAVTSLSAEKSAKNRERNMVDEITRIFTKKADEIKNDVNVALEQSDLVGGDQDLILNILMNWCSWIGEKIKKIRISAYNSDSFLKFFVSYFKNGQSVECENLMILMHNQDERETRKIADGWDSLIKNKTIPLEIRRAKTDRRFFFSMTIEFEIHHSIGLIGFYKPQDPDNKNEIIPNPFDKRYGVFSKRNSILEVLDNYFDYYFNDKNSKPLIIEDPKKTSL